MNLIQVFSVRDVVSDIYGTPFYSQNVGTATRSVSIEVNSGQASVIAGSPDDFELYHLGSFDQDTGRFQLLDAPVLLVRCGSLRAAPISGS